MIKEITERKKEKSKCWEEDFRTLIIRKVKQDLKIRITTESEVKLLIDKFGDLISDAKFLAWLASKLDYHRHYFSIN